jgi:hypothetical protein
LEVRHRREREREREREAKKKTKKNRGNCEKLGKQQNTKTEQTKGGD